MKITFLTIYFTYAGETTFEIWILLNKQNCFLLQKHPTKMQKMNFQFSILQVKNFLKKIQIKKFIGKKEARNYTLLVDTNFNEHSK